MKRLLSVKREIMSFAENETSQQAVLRVINKVVNQNSDQTMHSDVTRKQASVTILETQGSNFCGS